MIDDLICGGKNLYYWVLERLFDLLDLLIGTVLGWLPNTPFRFEPLEWGEFGRLVGYFFPVQAMASNFVVVLTAVGLYYAIRYLLRMLKLVQ